MEKFFWGTAISSYQTEGGNDDWSDWGKWNPRAGKACDFWNNYEKYLDLAKEIGTNSIRFSLEWGRIEPSQGEWNENALKHYRQMIAGMRKRGLEPFITLTHFTLPQWVAEQGGWSNPSINERFLKYAERVANALGEQVNYWVITNEPATLITQGYITGVWPPGYHLKIHKHFVACANLKQAIKSTAKLLRKISPHALVGSVFAFGDAKPARTWNLADRFAAWLMRRFDDREFIAQVHESLDFIGYNYYTRYHLKAELFPNFKIKDQAPVGARTSNLGWEIFPSGFKSILLSLHKKFGKPIIVTENGIADANDSLRPEFIQSHIASMLDAKAEGVDVRGYFHWSLMDNFEWAHGFESKFGLYKMDYESMRAIKRNSAAVYAELIQKHS